MDAATHSRKTPLHSSLRYRLISFMGQEHVHAASASDIVAGVQPKLVLVPGSESDLADAFRLVSDAGLAVVPRGGGTKLCWGNPPSRADVVFSTARLNEVTEHAWADLTASVGAGCTIQTLQETLAQHGQRLALDPLWPAKATVGGVLSANDRGALRFGHRRYARASRWHAGQQRGQGRQERRGLRSAQARHGSLRHSWHNHACCFSLAPAAAKHALLFHGHKGSGRSSAHHRRHSEFEARAHRPARALRE